VLADTVEDVARTIAAMAGTDPRDAATAGLTPEEYVEEVEAVDDSTVESLTVGVPDELFGGDPEVDKTVRDAVNELGGRRRNRQRGVHPGLRVRYPGVVGDRDDRGSRVHGRERHQLLAAFGAGPVVHGGGGGGVLGAGGRTRRLPRRGVPLRQHLMAEYGDEYYARAQRARKLVTAGVDDALDGVDVLAGPTTPMVAPAWDSGNYLEDSTLDEAVRTTGPFNLTGHPAVSVPCGSEDGLPVGLQFIGRRGGDADALRAAAVWEAMDE